MFKYTFKTCTNWEVIVMIELENKITPNNLYLINQVVALHTQKNSKLYFEDATLHAENNSNNWSVIICEHAIEVWGYVEREMVVKR